MLRINSINKFLKHNKLYTNLEIKKFLIKINLIKFQIQSIYVKYKELIHQLIFDKSQKIFEY